MNLILGGRLAMNLIIGGRMPTANLVYVSPIHYGGLFLSMGFSYPNNSHSVPH